MIGKINLDALKNNNFCGKERKGQELTAGLLG
jgi:hypothetical protein